MQNPMATVVGETQGWASSEENFGSEGCVRRVQSGLLKDARNLVTSLSLCSELIAEPGVLAPQHEHYARELELMVQAGRLLLEKIDSQNMAWFCRYAAVCKRYETAPLEMLKR